MNDKITIISITYNAKDVLEETILSVINQTYSNIEYIIIDGGSTDGTLDIIKKYEDKIAYWVSELDNGIYDAMNKGVKVATGEWVNFMNAGDCFYEEGTLNNIFENKSIGTNNVEILYGDTLEVFSFSNLLSKAKPLQDLNYHMSFCHQSSFVRLHILKESEFDEKYKICADYNLFYTLYKRRKVFKYIPDIISIYNAEDGFSVANNFEMIKESLYINRKIGHYLISYFHLIKQRIIKKLLPGMVGK